MWDVVSCFVEVIGTAFGEFFREWIADKLDAAWYWLKEKSPVLPWVVLFIFLALFAWLIYSLIHHANG